MENKSHNKTSKEAVTRKQHKLQEDFENAFIDPKIKKLVAALNVKDKGVRTIGSCEGHFEGLSMPYVYFKSPEAIASLIAKSLYKFELDNATHFNWQISGMFNGDFKLCYYIQSNELKNAKPNELKNAKHSIFKSFMIFIIQRKQIDEDLELLAEMVEKIFCKGVLGHQERQKNLKY